MRLKEHREDVKYLQKLSENRLSLVPIARRYLNLIFWAEAVLADEDLDILERWERVVVKDAGGKG